MWFRRQQQAQAKPSRSPAAHNPWEPDSPVVQWDPSGNSATLAELSSGVQVFGQPGSGKTRGPVRLLTSSILATGAGGLFLCAKRDDAAFYSDMVRRAGRSSQLLHVRPGGEFKLDFLHYEANRPQEEGGGYTQNITSLLDKAAQLIGRTEGSKQQGDNIFFHLKAKALSAAAIDTLRLSGAKITVRSILELVSSSPTPQCEAKGLWDRCTNGFDKPEHFADPLRVEELRNFWQNFARQSDRSRGDVVATFTIPLEALASEPARSLFCSGTTNFIPEIVDQGYIILFDVPPLVFNEVGSAASGLMKVLVQRHAMRRGKRRGHRPMFIIADEAQLFVHQDDATTVNTIRESGCITMYATQSIENYNAALHERNSPAVSAMLDSLTATIFCANKGSTNDYAEKLLGKVWTPVTSVGFQSRDNASNSTGAGNSVNTGQQLSPQILANAITRFRTGKPEHQGIIDALLIQPGKQFTPHGQAYARLQFTAGDLS